MCIFTLHVTKFSFNIPKIKGLKIEKKTSIEAQSKGHALEHKTSESRLTKTNLKRMLCWKREISATLIQLHLKELCCEHGKCYSHTLAPGPDIRP